MGKPVKSSDLRDLVGRRLKAARMAYDPNQAAMARLLEIDPRQLAKYELGKLFPDEALIVKFCRITGCTADWLYLGRIGEPMPIVMAARIGVLAPDLVAPAGAVSRKAAAVL